MKLNVKCEVVGMTGDIWKSLLFLPVGMEHE